MAPKGLANRHNPSRPINRWKHVYKYSKSSAPKGLVKGFMTTIGTKAEIPLRFEISSKRMRKPSNSQSKGVEEKAEQATPSSTVSQSQDVANSPLGVAATSAQRISAESASSAASEGDPSNDTITPRHKSSATASAEQSSAGSTAMKPYEEQGALEKFQNLAQDNIFKPFRSMVSQNRRRYQVGNFDLDLTYITDRIIAMGYPASASEAVYRNSMPTTQRFLESRHGNHYKVFNLRGQYVYDTARFQHRVVSFEMTDHHPPRLELMAPFCREVHEYLEADPLNIVAVHCKAGKGRTGVMICAYLVYIGFYPSPRQNMDYYSIVRTKNNKGVTIPSQRRYIYYFSHLRKHSLNYMPLRVELIGVYMERPPCSGGALSRRFLSLRVANEEVDVFLGDEIKVRKEVITQETREWRGAGGLPLCSRGPDSYDPLNPVAGNDVVSRRAYGWTVPSNKRVFLEGDVRVDIYCKEKIRIVNVDKERDKIGHIWWNTMFACPQFCGGCYQHGDEAHPYPPGETTIACRKVSTASQETSHGMRTKSGSASVPSSPPGSPKLESPATRVPSFDARKSKSSSSTGKLQHNAVRKVTEGMLTRNSEPNIERNVEDKPSERHRKKTDAGTSDSSKYKIVTEELQLVLPPGLDVHCPKDMLDKLYPAKDHPRDEIKKVLINAHEKNLISDEYNRQRLSVPQGTPVSKAPDGRPRADGTDPGPYCITRACDEHVQTYNVLEIDRAHKRKDINPGFKLIVITRCVPNDGPDAQLAQSFLTVTREKQMAKNVEKQNKVDGRLRKLQDHGSRQREGTNQDSFIDDSRWVGDERINDPHLKKFFYRQRDDSVSRYPPAHYKCPLLEQGEPSSSSAPTLIETVESEPANVMPSRRAASLGKDDGVDVRSYHPESAVEEWSEHSEASASDEEDDITLGADGKKPSNAADEDTVQDQDDDDDDDDETEAEIEPSEQDDEKPSTSSALPK
ncbi:unnamed protein product, partial [Mesorhabditis belari]|uniref:Phosphatidylinositol-3,4,5-trisphosphate 3-phosphatase n=1 Tax=Mesorhabditis belari TaxID=2138241 RepID=A0AAF3FEL4_9BILA